MEKKINLPPKRPKKEEKAYRGRKLIATLGSSLWKDSRPMESLRGFWCFCHGSSWAGSFSAQGWTPEHAGSRVEHEMWPPKANTPSPHTYSCCWALSSVAPWEWTTPSLFLCLCHIYFQASPPRASHSLAAPGHPGRCFLRCVYCVIKGNDSRSFRRYLSTRREAWVASQ